MFDAERMSHPSGSPRRVPLVALTACLVVWAAGARPSNAEETPPQPAPSPIENLIEENAPEAVRTLDETHAQIEQEMLERVARFDDFFGNVKTEDARPADYSLRWQNSIRSEEGGHFAYRTSARASLRLPKIGKRLRMVIAGENEAEPAAATLPEDPGKPGFDRTLARTRLVNTEVRYEVLRTPSLNLFLGAGVRLAIPAETFARGRIQCTRRLGPGALVRVGETLFWKNTDRLGETTEIDVERQLGPATLLRWANSGTATEDSEGLDWGTDLTLLRELSASHSITLAAGAFGGTRPVAEVQTYRVLSRYRRNFLRSWLFFEAEPEVSWPRDQAGVPFAPVYAFTFRLEVVFQGSAATKKGSPGDPGEQGKPR